MRRTQLARALRQELVPSQFTHGPWQWGVVEAVHATPPTVDVYLDGTQTLSNTAYLTLGVRYLGWYTPVVGDVVFVSRGTGGLRTDRVVLGTLSAGEPGRPFVMANATATTSCLTATQVQVPMAAISYSSGGFTIGTGGNVGLLILPFEGLYDVAGSVEAGSASALWNTEVWCNGTVALGNGVAGQSISGLVRASAADQTLGLYVEQTTGSTVVVGDAATGTYLHATYLGPA